MSLHPPPGPAHVPHPPGRQHPSGVAPPGSAAATLVGVAVVLGVMGLALGVGWFLLLTGVDADLCGSEMSDYGQCVVQEEVQRAPARVLGALGWTAVVGAIAAMVTGLVLRGLRR